MDNSPLGTLSPDLRNEIWELVLVHPEVEVKIKHDGARLSNGGHLSLALTATCQQSHREATPLFYSLNKFAVGKSWGECQESMAWLSRFCTTIGPANVRSLRSVNINFADIRHLWTANKYRRDVKTRLQQGIVGDSFHPDCEISAECLILARQIDHGDGITQRVDICVIEYIPFAIKLHDVESDWKLLRHTVADLIKRLELVIEGLQD